MSSRQVNLNVQPEIMMYLEKEATRRNVSVDVVVSDVLSDYFDEPDDVEILARFERSLQQAKVGQVRSAHTFLDELDSEETDEHADNS